MQVEPWMALEPFLDDRMLVRGVVIHDQMQLQALGGLPVDLFQESQPLLMPVLCFDAADQPTLDTGQAKATQSAGLPEWPAVSTMQPVYFQKIESG